MSKFKDTAVGEWLNNLKLSLKYKRLSKRKNWKIKKFICVDDSFYFKVYYRNSLRFWRVWTQPHIGKKGRIFSTDKECFSFVSSRIKENKEYYNHIRGSKVKKVEVVKTKKEKREDNINKII